MSQTVPRVSIAIRTVTIAIFPSRTRYSPLPLRLVDAVLLLPGRDMLLRGFLTGLRREQRKLSVQIAKGTQGHKIADKLNLRGLGE